MKMIQILQNRQVITMVLNKVILHILDTSLAIPILSAEELALVDGAVFTYIEKQIKRLFIETSQTLGLVSNSCTFGINLKRYKDHQLSFVDFSTLIATQIFDQLLFSDQAGIIDLIVFDATINEETIIGFFLAPCKDGFVHQVINLGKRISNEIIQHFALMPNLQQKLESYAIVEVDSLSVKYADRVRFIDNKDVFILPDIIFECTRGISNKAAIKELKVITSELAETSGTNPALCMSRLKTFLVENAEFADSVLIDEVSSKVFPEDEVLQRKFSEKTTQAELPNEIPLQRSQAIKTARNHKIRTDTGIEIQIPSEYFENRDIIRFVNNPNGKISIEILNVGRITNKN